MRIKRKVLYAASWNAALAKISWKLRSPTKAVPPEPLVKVKRTLHKKGSR